MQTLATTRKSTHNISIFITLRGREPGKLGLFAPSPESGRVIKISRVQYLVDVERDSRESCSAYDPTQGLQISRKTTKMWSQRNDPACDMVKFVCRKRLVLFDLVLSSCIRRLLK